MTPKSIETGRRMQVTSSLLSVEQATQTTVAVARGDRVALSVAISSQALETPANCLSLGILVGGTFVPLTTLTAGHPACYLSVDKIGTAIMGAIIALSFVSDTIDIGVTEVRQIQPLE